MPEADALAGHGDAQGVDDLADRDALGLDERVQRPLERRGVERLDLGQRRAEPREQLDRAGRLADPLVERLFVVGELVVGREEVGEVQDVAGHLDPVARRRDEGFAPGRRSSAVAGAAIRPALSRNGSTMAAFRSSGSSCMWRSWNDCSFTASKLAGALLTRSSEKCSISSARWKCSVLSSSDQPSRAR